LKLIFLSPKRTFLRRTTSYDVLSAKIGPTGSSLGARKKRKKEVNIRRFGCIFHVCGGKNPRADWPPNFSWRQMSAT